MNTPTVSVIIPAHNSAVTIAEALDSVSTQTRPVTEIIVVDDASSDNTVNTVEAWNRQHGGCVHLIPQRQNTGPAGARNAGIRQATGDWVAFLDADDAWLPHKIETQLNAISTHPGAALICGGTIALEASDAPLPPPSPVFRIAQLKLDEFITRNPVATSTTIVKRSVIESTGLFDEQFRGPEDYDLWLRIVSDHECLQLEIPLSRYRTTVGSLSMDDRTFLPQVLSVLHKAFHADGSLHAHQGFRRRAYAEQFTSASWMAYNRGDRMTALRHLFRSWCCGFVRLHKEHEDRLQRIKLLLRYLRPKK